MREPKLYVIFSHALIGAGFFFLYMQHVRVIFETRTNISHLNQLESESLLRHEDALYYSFYKTLANGPDFWHGYELLKNVTDIEYPHSVNVLQRFYVLPELITGFFFHLVRNSFNPLLQPMHFYFEFVWLMGGLTLLVLYLYGTLLSQNVFGGIYGVISYLMFHSFASKIYDRPLARENFAFPFIFLQMFYLCICIGRLIQRQRHNSRIFMIFTMSIFTACAMLSWQFSSIIFTSQILIVMTSWNVYSMPVGLANTFAMDYALSHLLGNGLAFLMSHGNHQLLYTWQIAAALSLFFITLARHIRTRRFSSDDQGDYFSLKFLVMAMLLGSILQTSLLELLGIADGVGSHENSIMHYCDIWSFWALQVKVNFVTNLSACNPMYARIAWSELWQLVTTLIVKPYCMYGVVMLAMFFRKWRKSNVPAAITEEKRERARNYVLEDFLEEHHVPMSDMFDKETQQKLEECFDLLKRCDYNYERYKTEKAKLQQEQPQQHKEFMQDIKRLREQIIRNTDKQRKERTAEQANAATPTLLPKENPPTKDAADGELLSSTITKNAETENDESLPSIAQNAAGNANGKRRQTTCTNHAAAASSSDDDSAMPTTNMEIRNPHYVYSFMQMILFTIIGLTVRKLFFLSFTQGCVIAPTVCSKVWYHRQRNIFWSVSLAVFLLSMFDPGLVNIREEYYPTRLSHNADDLDSMLEWIKLNTEQDAVFAGPVEIIGTVHLTTRRPIVNHAHIEMHQMIERTEQAYAVYSRQQSSDIYTQCSQLKIQYLIISLDECTNEVRDDCDILSIWDDKQPAYRKYPQFCHELLHKNIPSFLKVYANSNYGIIKMFSQSVQINLKYNKMPEMSM